MHCALCSVATLLPLLQKVDATLGIRRLHITSCARATAGMDGVNALRTQTIELLNGKSVDKDGHTPPYNVSSRQ